MPTQAEQADKDVNDASDSDEYQPNAEQLRADRSFSNILINTPFDRVQGELSVVSDVGCEANAECDWLDTENVRYTFWGNGPDDLWVVVKTVHAEEFAERPIAALGIGIARSRDEVLANVRDFFPTVAFTCETYGDDELCTERVLQPGWLRIWFENGQLSEVRLDGYHFT